jgi:stage V sporulation protein SpoVS
MDFHVRFIDPDEADVAARRLLRDIGAAAGIDGAALGTSEGQGGEKGVVEDIGLVIVSVINAIGIGNLMDALRAMLPARRPLAPDTRKIIVKLPDGTQIELEGAMSDAEYHKAARKALSVVEKASKDAAS